MRNFHLTHIAVNLLLIVALAIQPVALCMAGGECAAGCSDTTFTCQGCGCCEVEKSDGRCGCCSGPAEVVKEETSEASCCSRKRISPEPSPEEVDEASESAIDSIDGVAVVRSHCLCERESQPLGDSTPRRVANENRDNLSLGPHDLDGDARNCTRLLAATRYAADVPVTMHFSQVILCTWRL